MALIHALATGHAGWPPTTRGRMMLVKGSDGIRKRRLPDTRKYCPDVSWTTSAWAVPRIVPSVGAEPTSRVLRAGPVDGPAVQTDHAPLIRSPASGSASGAPAMPSGSPSGTLASCLLLALTTFGLLPLAMSRPDVKFRTGCSLPSPAR